MARIRSIHPGLFTDDEYMALSFPARELLKGLWCEADDCGVFELKARTLKARIMPADAVDMEGLISELEEHRFFTRFEFEGKWFGAIRNFRVYQRPKKPNQIHPLPDALRTYVGLSDVSSEPVRNADEEPVPHQFPTSGENPPQMEDGGDNSIDIPPSPLLAELDPEPESEDPDFSAWWEVYPRHVGKGAARRAYFKAKTKTRPEMLLDGARFYASERLGQDEKFTVHPATWLNQERWLDERASSFAINGGFPI